MENVSFGAKLKVGKSIQGYACSAGLKIRTPELKKDFANATRYPELTLSIDHFDRKKKSNIVFSLIKGEKVLLQESIPFPVKNFSKGFSILVKVFHDMLNNHLCDERLKARQQELLKLMSNKTVGDDPAELKNILNEYTQIVKKINESTTV